jgi:DNA ligase D-like protein (predicted polymerase)
MVSRASLARTSPAPGQRPRGAADLPAISHQDLQLLSLAREPFNRDGWIFELKYDGFRSLAIKQRDRLRLVTRQGSELGAAFPEITAELATLPDCVLDGELVVLDDQGIPQFDAVVTRSKKSTPSAIAAAARQTPAAFLAFDLLAMEDRDLRKVSLLERKKRLAELLRGVHRIKAVEYVERTGIALFEAVEKMGLEGIVAKNAASVYRRGRNSDWLKIKTEVGVKKTEERGDNWFTGPSAETLARRAARDAATGAAKLKATSQRPTNAPYGQTNPKVLRSATSESITVSVEGEELTLTHLSRVLWPPAKGQPQPITKGDYLAYLLEVAPYMLPHLIDRPLTLFVYNQGIRGRKLVEMHWNVKPPEFVHRVQIYSTNSKRDHTYWMVTNVASLLWFANAGALEFHPWHSRLSIEPDAKRLSTVTSKSAKNLDESVLNYPDYIFFDLDSYLYSGKERGGAEPEYNKKGFERCKRAALKLRDLLTHLSLEAFVKTSGKTGLHVVVPVVRTVDYDTVREISREIFTYLLREAPEDFTMEQSVAHRTGKTFLDFRMNSRASSMAAAYTVRAVPGAWVSMPITWQELRDIEPTDFQMNTVLARLKSAGDKWRDLLQRKQQIGGKRA